jgi:alcohol dehydrogenase class IV
VTYGDAYFRDLSADLEVKAGAPVLTVDDIAPNPDIALLQAQTARFADLKKQPAVIVALGGGSVIDSAKVFAAARGDFGAMEAYLKKRAGAETIKPWPLIAVPTTAGTGSEVTCWGTVWDDAAGVKFSLAHPGLYPESAIVDPDLMIGKPRDLTIQTGLDALSHSLESLWNRNANPVSMVRSRGLPIMRSGSTIADSGYRPGWASENFRPAAWSQTVPQQVTSLPVPAVVGTAISGHGLIVSAPACFLR